MSPFPCPTTISSTGAALQSYRRRLPLEQAHDLGFRQRIEMQIEADNGSGGIVFHGELVGFHRKHREQIAVRMIALGRAWAAVAGRAEIRAGLHRARG